MLRTPIFLVKHRKSLLPRLRNSLKPSSKDWLKRQTLDPFSVHNSQPTSRPRIVSKGAVADGIPGVLGGGCRRQTQRSGDIRTIPVISRAQHKLPLLLPPGSSYGSVLDVGCRPFSWSYQIFLTGLKAGGRITGVDVLDGNVPRELEEYAGFTFILSDICDVELEEGYDLIMSDASPNRTGNRRADAARQNGLSLSILEKCSASLCLGGDLIIKVLGGEGEDDVKDWGVGRFERWRKVKPRGVSRGREGYYVGQGRKAP